MPAHDWQAPKCYLVVAYAPSSKRAREANREFNAYIDDEERGLVLCHDHFVDCKGGYAVFVCEDEDQARATSDASDLPGWQIKSHPLVIAENAVRWLYQCDFTSTVYRGRRLADLMEAYQTGPLRREIDALEAGDGR